MIFKNKTSNKEGEGRNWMILVFSLLLAFIMWMGQKFSKDYSWYLNYKIEVTTDISGRANKAISPDLLILSAKVRGFDILYNSYKKEKQVLKIENVDNKFFHRKDRSDIFYLLPNDIKQKIQEAIGGEILLESIITDSLSFVLPPQAYKRVPIIAKTDISYKSQFMPISDINLTPDSVNIYGDKEVTDRISHLSTKLIKGDNVDATLSGVVKINPIKGVKFSSSEIVYTQLVERFVETKIYIPIVVENVPDDANITLIPNEVELTYRQPFSRIISRSSADFTIVVNYLDIKDNKIVQPNIIRKPEEVISYNIEPKFIECIF